MLLAGRLLQGVEESKVAPRGGGGGAQHGATTRGEEKAPAPRAACLCRPSSGSSQEIFPALPLTQISSGTPKKRKRKESAIPLSPFYSPLTSPSTPF